MVNIFGKSIGQAASRQNIKWAIVVICNSIANERHLVRIIVNAANGFGFSTGCKHDRINGTLKTIGHPNLGSIKGRWVPKPTILHKDLKICL